jgi:hypothetical protein
MPVSELDLVKGGLRDFHLDNLKISGHAMQRCRERHIPLEDLRRVHNNQVGFGVQCGNTIVTALTNTMKRPPGERPGKPTIDQVKTEIRKRKESMGLCKSMKTKFPDHYTYFRNLLQHHPTGAVKRVTEIVDLALVKQNQRKTGHKGIHNANDLMFVAIYSDGARDTISTSQCIQPYIQASSDPCSQILPPLLVSEANSPQSALP